MQIMTSFRNGFVVELLHMNKKANKQMNAKIRNEDYCESIFSNQRRKAKN